MAVVVAAQRLSNLLFQFPAAAVGGVQWRVLVRRYEDRYGARLDLSTLGQSSAVAAATALLWDVLRLVSREDAENPMVAIEDAAALTPRPGYIGTWPSLYLTLCELVRSNGTLEPPAARAAGTPAAPARGLLLSQLKPLLQRHWHANFDDSGLGFMSEEGAFVKMKKMKHLVQAVLQWRDQRVEWRRSSGSSPTEVDAALQSRLELVVSKTHNDLILRCPLDADQAAATATAEAAAGVPLAATPVPARPAAPEEWQAPPQLVHAAESRRAGDGPCCEGPQLQRELASLRAENKALRQSNEQLLREKDIGLEAVGGSSHRLPVLLLPTRGREAAVEEDSGFDDPFEPPPQRLQSWAATPTAASTMTPASLELFSGASTRASMTPLSGLGPHSGAMTPVPTASLGDRVCALVPMWFSWVPNATGLLGDRCDIPTGIVDRLRSRFESAAAADAAPPMPQAPFARQ